MKKNIFLLREESMLQRSINQFISRVRLIEATHLTRFRITSSCAMWITFRREKLRNAFSRDRLGRRIPSSLIEYSSCQLGLPPERKLTYSMLTRVLIQRRLSRVEASRISVPTSTVWTCCLHWSANKKFREQIHNGNDRTDATDESNDLRKENFSRLTNFFKLVFNSRYIADISYITYFINLLACKIDLCTKDLPMRVAECRGPRIARFMERTNRRNR